MIFKIKMILQILDKPSNRVRARSKLIGCLILAAIVTIYI
jgi:hypothetical protein